MGRLVRTMVIDAGPAGTTSQPKPCPAEPCPAGTRQAAASANSRAKIILAVCAALAASLALQHGRLIDVWASGGFYDTDDAMRMVQVRDLLAGQSWYDMTAWRLDPPQGLFSHWSRLVDIPIALFVKFFGLFLAPEAAERAARIAEPTATFGVLLAGGAWAARIFAGRDAAIIGIFAVLFCGVVFWQFPPGRIDHHAQQITLLFFAVAALARALDPEQARWAALTGACMSVSIGIGLENLPFFGLLAAIPGLVFLFRGAEARPLLRSFATGFAVSLLAVAALTIGPSRWLAPACDALAVNWAAPALLGALGYCALSLPGRLHLAGRALTLAAVGAAALAPIPLFWPSCLQSPYAGVDPIVKSLWLDHVGENLTLRENFSFEPGGSLLMAIPVLIGLLGALFGGWVERGAPRARWLLLAATIALGFLAATQCLRLFSSTMPLAAMGLLAPAALLRRRLAARGGMIASASAFAAMTCCSAFGVALAMPEVERPQAAELSPHTAWRRPDPCLDSANYLGLAALQPGLAVAQIPAGAYLLAHTGLSVLAAPYHRNNHGNRAALDILRAEPALAETLARRAGAKYVLLCWGTPADLAALAAMGTDGLAAQISSDRIPGWLRPIPLQGSIFHAYEILPPGN